MENEKQRSYWTGKRKEDLVSLSTDFLPEFNRPKDILYVEAEFQEKLKDTLLWFSRNLLRSYGFLIIGIIGFVVNAMGNASTGGMLIMIMGLGLVIFPFATSSTMDVLGVRNSIYVGRICGVGLVFLGFFMGFVS